MIKKLIAFFRLDFLDMWTPKRTYKKDAAVMGEGNMGVQKRLRK